MTFSPYAPVVHEMLEITDPTELAAANAADGELPLKDRLATHVYDTEQGRLIHIISIACAHS